MAVSSSQWGRFGFWILLLFVFKEQEKEETGVESWNYYNFFFYSHLQRSPRQSPTQHVWHAALSPQHAAWEASCACQGSGWPKQPKSAKWVMEPWPGTQHADLKSGTLVVTRWHRAAVPPLPGVSAPAGLRPSPPARRFEAAQPSPYPAPGVKAGELFSGNKLKSTSSIC